MVLPRVEADRREQLGAGAGGGGAAGRAAAGDGDRRAAQGEITHPGAGFARADWGAARAGEEWIAERFPEPMQRLKNLGRELTSARERTAVPLDLEQVKARGRQASDQWRKDLHRQQAAQKQAALEQRELEQVVKEFKDLAMNRAMRLGVSGSERGLAGDALGLRATIDRFNALPPAAQARVLERMAREPAFMRDLQQGSSSAGSK